MRKCSICLQEINEKDEYWDKVSEDEIMHYDCEEDGYRVGLLEYIQGEHEWTIKHKACSFSEYT